MNAISGAGTGKVIASSSAGAQPQPAVSPESSYGWLSSFDTGGFTTTNGTSTWDNYNKSGDTYVAWTWLGSNTTASNTNGSITSTVCANQTAGFSVVTYTLNNSTFTVGHGLSAAPSMIMVKDLDTANNWDVYHISIGAGSRIVLNDAGAPDVSSQVWNNTAPTSTVFSGNSAWWTNPSTSRMIAFCFTPIAGYSAFGSYTGNGSTDGPFVYLGFRPAFILFKRYSGTGNDWRITDSTRSTYNPDNTAFLYPNDPKVENSNANDDLDMLSNGFKIRATAEASNSSGSTYIYMAFAENPFKYANAR
jgi:hypothetical protein